MLVPSKKKKRNEELYTYYNVIKPMTLNKYIIYKRVCIT